MSALGLSGWLTKGAIRSPLTPLFLLTAFFLGLLALSAIPREEEPQISVPMVDVHIAADGIKAPDAVELITKPLETILKGIDAVEHVYSQTQDDHVMVMARFKVGTSADDAILRVHEKVRANYDRMPAGIPEPLIVGRGINDVAILTLTLSPKPEAADRWSDAALLKVADDVQTELAKVDNVGLSYIVGGNADQIRVEPQMDRLVQYGLTLQELMGKVQDANRSLQVGRVLDKGRALDVVAGQTLQGIPDISQLLLTTREGRPVYVGDVATVTLEPRPASSHVWTAQKDESSTHWATTPAITVAFAKRAGANAVVLGQDLLTRLDTLKGRLIPADLSVEVTRNYGETANDKASELLFHLALATVSIVALIGFAIGRREGVVTLVVIPTTILLTLFASYIFGYTINRVSLFALIFSIGILVDDAVVVVENIARHWAMKDGRGKWDAAIDAVSEVGNPTILATLTVIVALLPMLFVSGLMGPYMAPIPVNASLAMLISFVVAVTVVPWLMLRLPEFGAVHHDDGNGGKLGALYRRVAVRVISTKRQAWKFLIIVGVATLASMMLFPLKGVTVKLLPFDNKSELAVVVDLPEGAALEDTERALRQMVEPLKALPEVVSVQGYAGTAAPFNFNGLVRHSYLRTQPEMGELQINLLPKNERARSSHALALEVRKTLAALPVPAGTVVKVVEVPPGPPVLSTLLAEIYGPDAATRRKVAEEVQGLFKSVPFVVDVDSTVESQRPRLRLSINQDQLDYFGVSQGDVYNTISSLMGGVMVGYSHQGAERNPLEIVVGLPRGKLVWSDALASTPIPANAMPGNRTHVELGDVVTAREELGSPSIFRRDGLAAEMVQAELAGAYEAPIYGMFAVADAIKAHSWPAGVTAPTIAYHGQPSDESVSTLLWDGEWEITYVTFRDMGAAFMVALVGIYILIVAHFKSFKLPLVILTPVPLTFIGILLGHFMFGAAFTATSMIGFIALAGIIVRNSILLVDFIRERRTPETSLRDVLLDAGAIRFRPILLTALAAMIGAGVILTDPIFQGLAISLLFGLASATLLTVLVIPAIYIVLRDDGRLFSG